MRIIKNPDKIKYKEVKQSVQDNNGYCPCSIIKSKETKCPCKAFREQLTTGECHCGLYVKIN